jgi:murein DD-endopeptidase MepM/ murein hydrolase activator NlpD
MSARRLASLVVAVAAGATGIAVAAPGDPAPRAGATALVAQVSVPGQTGGGSGTITAPPDAAGGGGFAYPAGGGIANVGAATTTAAAQPGISSSAQGLAEILGVSLLGGEITVDAIALRATAAAGPGGATSDTNTSSVTGLVVLGQPVASAPGLRLPLADWGTLDVLATTTTSSEHDGRRLAETAIVGLRLLLVAEHAGLPAGTEVVIGTVSASAVAEPSPTGPGTKPTPTPVAPSKPEPPKPTQGPNAPREPGRSIPGAPPELVRDPPADVKARLSTGGYVFPVYGPVGFGDTFGASRPNVSGGWHHGEDLVAPLGTPLLAVADGTLFSVGWNDIGGWRLWLRDDAGNEFYYAHLSAYAPIARDGARVKAGDVIGFLGKSGDAERSIPHLHFEIHPAPLLGLGYDGAVAPYPFLVAWRRADDVSFASGRRFTVDGIPVAAARAGAVLLQADDISRRSGLVPGALGRALTDEGGARPAKTP